MEKQIKMSILCEDQATMGFRDKLFLAQHGLSIFIDAGQKILFDAGPSNVFTHNAELLGIDLNGTDWIVLSHGHWDHTDGLTVFDKNKMKRMNLLVHPGAFVDRRKVTGQYNGMAWGRQDFEKRFHLFLSKEPFQLTETIYFLGEIPRKNDFEATKTSFYHITDTSKHPDFIQDDSALAIKTQMGLLIITGCSHAGICNIVEHARVVTGQRKIHAVIGGFHLLKDEIQLKRTVEYFEKNSIDCLYPMHCTDLPSLCKFHKVFGARKLCVGDSVVFSP